jgi:O-antigen biosynthesis protein
MTFAFTPPAIDLDARLKTAFHWSQGQTFSGYVVDTEDPGRTFIVELLVDGYPVKCARAADRVEALAADGLGDGCYGFSFSLADTVLDDATIVEARIANLGTAIGTPIFVRDLTAARSTMASAPGTVRWLGGLRFSGWLADAEDPTISIAIDGERVAEVSALGWRHIGDAGHAHAVRALDFHLPERFADGAAHRLAATTVRGEHLEGSPLPFLAFDGSLRQIAAANIAPGLDELRAEMFDRLVPMSIPFADYSTWRSKRAPAVPPQAQVSAAVIVVGPGDVDETLTSLHAQSHPDWVAVSLPEAADDARSQSAAALEFLEGDGADAGFVLFLPSGTTLHGDALARLSETFANDSTAIAVYGDVDVAGPDGARWPLAFPAFDYERMLEQGYCSQVFALRAAAARRSTKAGAVSLSRIFNALLDDDVAVAANIVHLPGALATVPTGNLDAGSRALAQATQQHLERRGVAARVLPAEGRVLPAVRVIRETGVGRVSIIIPTRNRRELLEACIGSLMPAVRGRDCEIIVIDNDSSDPMTLDYLARIDGREATVLRVPGDFNFARLNNRAAEAAGGEYLCLLNNDVEALDSRWLAEMLGRIADPDVGAVGAQLLWPSGVVQHGGVVLGPGFAAAHAFNDRMDGDAGYGDLLRVAHECSAVTAACLLTRRADYLALGGMDAFRFPVNFNDVDYCLKLRSAGKRVVFTPHAKLLHRESASRGSDKQPDRRARLERELQNLRAKWGNVLAADPFYNPMLSLDPIPFSALAWPLRSMVARTSQSPRPLAVPAGL